MNKEDWLISFIVAPYAFIILLILGNSQFYGGINNDLIEAFVLVGSLIPFMVILTRITSYLLIRYEFITNNGD